MQGAKENVGCVALFDASIFSSGTYRFWCVPKANALYNLIF